MSRIAADNGPFEENMLIDCRVCGMVGGGPASTIPACIERHWSRIHPDTTVIAAGIDYQVRPAATRCDACPVAIELPYWRHVSDPPTDGRITKDADGIWYLCDTCHDLFAAGKVTAWVRYAWAQNLRESPFLSEVPERHGLRADLAEKFHKLMLRLDEGRRLTLMDH